MTSIRVSTRLARNNFRLQTSEKKPGTMNGQKPEKGDVGSITDGQGDSNLE